MCPGGSDLECLLHFHLSASKLSLELQGLMGGECVVGLVKGLSAWGSVGWDLIVNDHSATFT